MQVNTNSSLNYNSYTQSVDNNKQEGSLKDVDGVNKLDQESVDSLKQEIKSYSISVAIESVNNFKAQSEIGGVLDLNDPEQFKQAYAEFQKTLDDIGYKGKPIAELSQEEASELVSEDGFFGVEKTSQRMADFVLEGAGDDVEKLKAGRNGLIDGYNQAQKMWGKEDLPDINKQTLDSALKKIDDRFEELGINIIDEKA